MFQNNKYDILPENIFCYYAGFSKRFETIVKTSNDEFYDIQKKGVLTTRKRPIINYKPIHCKISFLILILSKWADYKQTLEEEFQITSLDRFGIIIKKPNWNKAKTSKFWDASPQFKGHFDNWEKMAQLSWVKNSVTEFSLFMFDAITNLKIYDFSHDEIGFFELLDTLDAIDYLHDIKIWFRKNDTHIEFEDLSEGEKQRLAIRSVMELFKTKETLFLLDEPDAFAHPRWQWDFVKDLQKSIGEADFQQVILATHSPLILSSVKENVFMLDNGIVEKLNYTFGKSVGEILTTEMESKDRIEEVDADFDKYFGLIERGMGNEAEALNLRAQLEAKYGANHSEFSRADMLILFHK